MKSSIYLRAQKQSGHPLESSISTPKVPGAHPQTDSWHSHNTNCSELNSQLCLHAETHFFTAGCEFQVCNYDYENSTPKNNFVSLPKN